MLKAIKKLFYNLIYSIPFGMKGADNEIFGDVETSNGNKIVVQQQVRNNNLGESLLQGEVTQEVEELRYQTYKVAKEADNFEYLGEGVAIKKKNVVKPTVINFVNKIICEGVTHELNRVGEYSIDRYTIKVDYNDVPRFKVEKYCNNVSVDLKEKTIKLFFEKNTNVPEIRMFHNELNSMLNGKRSELNNNLQAITFFTNDTFTKYELRNLSYENLVEERFEYVLIYSFKHYIEEDIVEKYNSKTMEEKYKNKEKKSNVYTVEGSERRTYCSMCGKEINTYDSDITTKTFGYPVCNDCIKKINDYKKNIINTHD